MDQFSNLAAEVAGGLNATGSSWRISGTVSVSGSLLRAGTD
ncbi:hypothetical protein [Streptomyces sp. NPDC001714]